MIFSWFGIKCKCFDFCTKFSIFLLAVGVLVFSLSPQLVLSKSTSWLLTDFILAISSLVTLSTLTKMGGYLVFLLATAAISGLALELVPPSFESILNFLNLLLVATDCIIGCKATFLIGSKVNWNPFSLKRIF